MVRCWCWVIPVAVVMALSACGGDDAAPRPVQGSSTSVAGSSPDPSVQVESGGDVEVDRSWSSTAKEDELVAFVGNDGRRVVVGSTDGRVVGSVEFGVQVEVGAVPSIDRVAARAADGSMVWMLDTSTGQVVGEYEVPRELGVIYAEDGVFSAEVVDGDVDGEGSVTIRETQTGTQRFYASAEPGWVLAGDGIVGARGSDLAAVPTSSTSSNVHALMVASAATGELVAFTGAEERTFLGWIGPSCWLSQASETVVVQCIDGETIESIMEVGAEAISAGGVVEIDPQHASIAGLGPLAFSLPLPAEDDRRVFVGSPATGFVESGSGSFPRWSPTGRFLAVVSSDVLLIRSPEGSESASYDDVRGQPVWTASDAP